MQNGKERRPAQPSLTLFLVLVSVAIELVIAAALLAWLHLSGRTPLAVFVAPTVSEIAAGVAIGSVLGTMQVVVLRAFPRWRAFSAASVGELRLGVREILVISVAVGFAEELLFRATLQPLIGNVWTSVLFAAVHANYSPVRHDRSMWPFSTVALAIVFALSLVLGVTFERIGLACAMLAHGFYDFIVLMAYRRLFVRRG